MLTSLRRHRNKDAANKASLTAKMNRLMRPKAMLARFQKESKQKAAPTARASDRTDDTRHPVSYEIGEDSTAGCLEEDPQQQQQEQMQNSNSSILKRQEDEVAFCGEEEDPSNSSLLERPFSESAMAKAEANLCAVDESIHNSLHQQQQQQQQQQRQENEEDQGEQLAEADDSLQETRHEFSTHLQSSRLAEAEAQVEAAFVSTNSNNDNDATEKEQSKTSAAALETFPCFFRSEIRLGKFLGRGSFCVVEEIDSIHLRAPSIVQPKLQDEDAEADPSEENDDTVDAVSAASRQFIVDHCRRHVSGDARYAVKRIQPSILKDTERFWLAAVDLAIETRFLANLEHPHIVKLRGVPQSGNLLKGGDDNCFLVLDRLYETLGKRIHGTWKPEQKSALVLHKRFTGPGKSAIQDILAERVAKAYDLSSALAYLHKRRIIHRDIKPENIGFDIRGDIKIFDFGLARELPDGDGESTFRLSKAGSLRFMAPEVALGHPYNDRCDSYSFAVLFWEMLSCGRPYESYKSEASFVKGVFVKQSRPRIWTRLWPKAIQTLLERGWNADWRERLPMSVMESVLHDELVKLRNEQAKGAGELNRGGAVIAGLDKSLRRSTAVFCRASAAGINRSSSHKRRQDAFLEHSEPTVDYGR